MSVRGAEGAGATGSEATERRAGGGPRVHFEALVAVGEAAGGGFEAESVDVSPDGMRLRTAYLPEVGDKLICRFDGMGTEVVAEGEVSWRNEQARGGEFGLRFTGLDGAAGEAVRAMCASLGGGPDEEPAGDEPSVPRGSRVRLHIEGLGSPMKARVRESASREVEVGSNLEFLKVGRALELEDVDQGSRREALIEDVKVDVDPATNVPQLVVMLRYGKAAEAPAAKRRDKVRTTTAPVTRRAAPPPPPDPAPARGEAEAAPAKPSKHREAPKAEEIEAGAEEREAAAAEADHDDGRASAHDEAGTPGFGARAASAGRAVAGKLAPALAGMGSRAKGAMGNVMDLIQRRRAERAEAQKAAAPRRMTAPPPGGAITNDGRRLVRDDGMDEDEEAAGLPPRTNKRAAAIGGVLGLLAVLAIFGVTRFAGTRGQTASAAAASDNRTAVAALPAAEAPAVGSAAPGTPTANVPLFGATPLSTTEPAAPAPSAVASAAPAAAPGEDEPAPADGKGGPILKEWGQGAVQHPVVLKIKMDGAIERINGAAGAMGFTISLPNRRSVSSASELARKDKRLASVNVVNTSHGAEVTVQFKDGVPPYLAKVKGDKLEIAIGREGHSKIAKSKKDKGKKKKH
jgi:hypothetical protein